MQEFTTLVNGFFGVLTIAADIISILLVIALASPVFRKSRFVDFFSNNAILVAFIVSLLATLGSLTYSDIIGYEPCKLCWFQRIFMYPQLILTGVALWKRHSHMRLYSLILSAFGAVVALFHYLGQIGLNPLGLGCLAVGYSSSCAKNFVLEFGYITIPLMALSAFLLIILSCSLSFMKEKEANQSL